MSIFKTGNFEFILLFEDYSDCTGDKSICEDDAFKEFQNYRQNKDKIVKEEYLESVTKANNFLKNCLKSWTPNILSSQKMGAFRSIILKPKKEKYMRP